MPRLIPRYDNYPQVGSNPFDPNLALANSDPLLIGRQLVSGLGVVHKFGASNAIPTGLTPVATALVYPTPTAATALEVVSSSADDTAAGTGARTVDIIGIADWDAGEVTERVTLNGTTAVPLTVDFLRVYRLKVATSGTYASSTAPSHNSTITLRAAGAGATWAQIISRTPFGLGQSEIAAYSVPAGKSAYMWGASVLVGTTKTVDVVFFVREAASTIAAPFSSIQTKIIIRNLVGQQHISPNTPYGPFVGPCDLGWMAAASVGTASVEIDFELIIVDA